MSKTVYTDARIILGGVDVSERVSRWSVGAKIGSLYIAEIDIQDTPEIIAISQDSRGRNKHGLRIPISDQVKVGGVDISSWIYRYDRITRVDKADVIRLYVQCDRDVLSINGTHPWELGGDA